MKSDTIQNCCDKPTLKQKLRRLLLPRQHCFQPDAPSDFQDEIRFSGITYVSLATRLRLLFTGICITEVRIVTENKVGETRGNGVLFAGGPWELKEAKRKQRVEPECEFCGGSGELYPECTCYEVIAGAHQPGCPFHGMKHEERQRYARTPYPCTECNPQEVTATQRASGEA